MNHSFSGNFFAKTVTNYIKFFLLLLSCVTFLISSSYAVCTEKINSKDLASLTSSSLTSEEIASLQSADLWLNRQNFNHLIISRKDYSFESDYDVDSNQGQIGNVVQNFFSFRKNYSLYSNQGELIFFASVRLFSLGSLWKSATALDIYDSIGQRLGTIKGTLLTKCPAKFYFYDSLKKLCGISYLDKARTNFTVVNPNNQRHILATFDRQILKEQVDRWVIELMDSNAIDPRLFISFASFLIDTQASFRIDD